MTCPPELHRDEESIMTIFAASSAPKPLHLAIYCYNGAQQLMGDGSYQQLCEYSVTVTVAALAALTTTLANRQSPQTATSLAVGQYKFLRFDVPGSSLTEVHMEVRARGAVPLLPPLALSVQIQPCRRPTLSHLHEGATMTTIAAPPHESGSNTPLLANNRRAFCLCTASLTTLVPPVECARLARLDCPLSARSVPNHIQISTRLEGAVGTTTRAPITVVASLHPAMTLAQQRSDVAVAEGRDGRLGRVRTNRGQPVQFTLYVDAPATLWVSVNNGLVPPEVWEDQTVPVSAAAWTQVRVCVLACALLGSNRKFAEVVASQRDNLDNLMALGSCRRAAGSATLTERICLLDSYSSPSCCPGVTFTQ